MTDRYRVYVTQKISINQGAGHFARGFLTESSDLVDDPERADLFELDDITPSMLSYDGCQLVSMEVALVEEKFYYAACRFRCIVVKAPNELYARRAAKKELQAQGVLDFTNLIVREATDDEVELHHTWLKELNK